MAFVVLFTLAMTGRVPLEQSADPSDNTYIPRPEWYFLFLFQMLKAFNGPLEALGTVVLPGAAVLVLILAPFIDRGRMVKVTKRTVALTLVALGAVTWTGLTAAAVVSTPKPERTAIDYSGPTGWLRLAPEELANPGGSAGCARVRHCRSFGLPGEPLRNLSHRQRGRKRRRPFAQRTLPATQPDLGGRPLCRAREVFAEDYHAGLQLLREGQGQFDELSIFTGGQVACSNACETWA